MDREFVVDVRSPGDRRFWNVRLDKYLRPSQVMPCADDAATSIERDVVVVESPTVAPTPREILDLLQRRYMHEHRRSV